MRGFSIEAAMLVEGRFRLTSSGTFRQLGQVRALSDSDIVLPTPDAAYIQVAMLPKELDLSGKLVERMARDIARLTDPVAHLEVCAHRVTRPPTPTRSAVKRALGSGDDEAATTVVVCLNGQVSVERFHSTNIDDPDYAVRTASFAADNGYVGWKAAEDREHVETVYRRVLFGWLQHLTSGRLGCYGDGASSVSTQDLEAQIAAVVFP